MFRVMNLVNKNTNRSKMSQNTINHRKIISYPLLVPNGNWCIQGVRALRPRFLTAATRGDWRAQIEDSSGSATHVSPTAAEHNIGNASTGTLQPKPTAKPLPSSSPPPSPDPAAAVPAIAPPPSPWSQPAVAPTASLPPASPAVAASSTSNDKAPAAASAPEGTRAELFSLPTFDLVEVLSKPRAQSTAFTVLAATSAILATLCILEPEAVLDLGLPRALISDVDLTFLRIAGVTLAASASVEYSLKNAADSQLLTSATYQRLMAACSLKSAGFLAVLIAATPDTFRLWSPLAWLAYALAAVASGAINLSVISHSSGKGLALPPMDSGTPQNPTAWGYTACVALYLLTVLACFSPETLFTGEPYSTVSPLVKGLSAPGFLLAAAMSYVLKDAADRGRLGASTFKNLNLGLAALEYGYSIIFGSAILSDQVDIDLPALSNLGGSLIIATFALYTYATAKK